MLKTILRIHRRCGSDPEAKLPLLLTFLAVFVLLLTPSAAEAQTTFHLFVPSGISLIHIPLKVTTVNNQAMVINTIGDLYNALGGANNVNFIITHDTSANVWRGYIGAQSKGAAADSTLTDDLGVITVMKNAVTLILNGNALGHWWHRYNYA